MFSVVIPACNEGGVIARALSAITQRAPSGEMDIVVVCNGCTDNTAEIARRFGSPARVIETAVANKARGLNLGDQAAGSALAANLAASLAGDGFSAVLVDCDQYRPAVHRMFRGPSAPGLTDYFSSAAELDQILYCDRRTGVNYIPVGQASPNPGITTDRLRLLIARLSKRYKYFILDSAPLLAVSETLLLSRLAEKTILVVKRDSTPLEIARNAVTELLRFEADIAIALSMVDMRRAAKYGDPQAAAYKRPGNYCDYKRTAE